MRERKENKEKKTRRFILSSLEPFSRHTSSNKEKRGREGGREGTKEGGKERGRTDFRDKKMKNQCLFSSRDICVN